VDVEERKLATVLFADLVGSTMAEEIERAGGTGTPRRRAG
jgi:class 3 adenylate cyclase